MSRTRIFLLRHGSVEDPGRFYGATDAPLSAQGRAQAAAAAQALASRPLGAVYCSTLARSREMARLIAQPHGLEPQALAALKELDFGDWERLEFGQASQMYPEQARAMWADPAGFVFPGGESLAQLAARVLPALERIVALNQGAEAAVVAHGGVNRAILAQALGLELGLIFSLAQDYAAVNVLEYYGDGRAFVRLVNAPAEALGYVAGLGGV